MEKSIKLPDAMPDVVRPTLMVICDSHHCTLFNIGGHLVVEKEIIQSHEHVSTDRTSVMSGVGLGDSNPQEEHRLREFSNTLMARLEVLIREQKIEEMYLSAPSKCLSALKQHMPTAVEKVLVLALDGNFAKEAPMSVLARFRPDLHDAVKQLREEENYSPKKHLPK